MDKLFKEVSVKKVCIAYILLVVGFIYWLQNKNALLFGLCSSTRIASSLHDSWVVG